MEQKMPINTSLDNTIVRIAPLLGWAYGTGKAELFSKEVNYLKQMFLFSIDLKDEMPLEHGQLPPLPSFKFHNEVILSFSRFKKPTPIEYLVESLVEYRAENKSDEKNKSEKEKEFDEDIDKALKQYEENSTALEKKDECIKTIKKFVAQWVLEEKAFIKYLRQSLEDEKTENELENNIKTTIISLIDLQHGLNSLENNATLDPNIALKMIPAVGHLIDVINNNYIYCFNEHVSKLLKEIQTHTSGLLGSNITPSYSANISSYMGSVIHTLFQEITDLPNPNKKSKLEGYANNFSGDLEKVRQTINAFFSGCLEDDDPIISTKNNNDLENNGLREFLNGTWNIVDLYNLVNKIGNIMSSTSTTAAIREDLKDHLILLLNLLKYVIMPSIISAGDHLEIQYCLAEGTISRKLISVCETNYQQLFKCIPLDFLDLKETPELQALSWKNPQTGQYETHLHDFRCAKINLKCADELQETTAPSLQGLVARANLKSLLAQNSSYQNIESIPVLNIDDIIRRKVLIHLPSTGLLYKNYKSIAVKIKKLELLVLPELTKNSPEENQANKELNELKAQENKIKKILTKWQTSHKNPPVPDEKFTTKLKQLSKDKPSQEEYIEHYLSNLAELEIKKHKLEHAKKIFPDFLTLLNGGKEIGPAFHGYFAKLKPYLNVVLEKQEDDPISEEDVITHLFPEYKEQVKNKSTGFMLFLHDTIDFIVNVFIFLTSCILSFLYYIMNYLFNTNFNIPNAASPLNTNANTKELCEKKIAQFQTWYDEQIKILNFQENKIQQEIAAQKVSGLPQTYKSAKQPQVIDKEKNASKAIDALEEIMKIVQDLEEYVDLPTKSVLTSCKKASHSISGAIVELCGVVADLHKTYKLGESAYNDTKQTQFYLTLNDYLTTLSKAYLYTDKVYKMADDNYNSIIVNIGLVPYCPKLDDMMGVATPLAAYGVLSQMIPASYSFPLRIGAIAMAIVWQMQKNKSLLAWLTELVNAITDLPAACHEFDDMRQNYMQLPYPKADSRGQDIPDQVKPHIKLVNSLSFIINIMKVNQKNGPLARTLLLYRPLIAKHVSDINAVYNSYATKINGYKNLFFTHSSTLSNEINLYNPDPNIIQVSVNHNPIAFYIINILELLHKKLSSTGDITKDAAYKNSQLKAHELSQHIEKYISILQEHWLSRNFNLASCALEIQLQVLPELEKIFKAFQKAAPEIFTKLQNKITDQLADLLYQLETIESNDLNGTHGKLTKPIQEGIYKLLLGLSNGGQDETSLIINEDQTLIIRAITKRLDRFKVVFEKNNTAASDAKQRKSFVINYITSQDFMTIVRLSFIINNALHSGYPQTLITWLSLGYFQMNNKPNLRDGLLIIMLISLIVKPQNTLEIFKLIGLIIFSDVIFNIITYQQFLKTSPNQQPKKPIKTTQELTVEKLGIIIENLQTELQTINSVPAYLSTAP
jgi:hypothetical protein